MRISDWSSDVCSSDLLEITHRSDAVHDGAEDHRRDHHLDQCDKPVAQGLHGGASLGKPPPGAGPDPDGEEHLDTEVTVPGNRAYASLALGVDHWGWPARRRVGIADMSKRSEERRLGKEGVRTCK